MGELSAPSSPAFNVLPCEEARILLEVCQNSQALIQRLDLRSNDVRKGTDPRKKKKKKPEQRSVTPLCCVASSSGSGLHKRATAAGFRLHQRFTSLGTWLKQQWPTSRRLVSFLPSSEGRVSALSLC